MNKGKSVIKTLFRLIFHQGEKKMKKGKTLAWKLLSVLVVLTTIISTTLLMGPVPVARAESTTIYTFAGVTTASCSSNGICAHESDVDQFPYQSNYDRNDFTQPSNTEYGRIAVHNSSRWYTDDPGSNDEIFVQLDMTINESIDSISQIDFTFIGNTDGGWLWPASTEHRIYVKRWNYGDTQSGAWTQLGTGQSITADTDGTMVRSLNSNFTTYINPTTGRITWGVYETRSSEDMRINYVQMAVTANVAPSKPALNLPLDDAYLATRRPAFSWFAATDPDDPPGDLTYQIRIDTSEINRGTNLFYTPASDLTEGPHTWCVRARDDSLAYSSEWATANCRDFIIDTDTPATPSYLNEGNPDQDYYANTAYSMPIYWGSVPSTGSGIYYQLDRRVNGGSWGQRYYGSGAGYTDAGTFSDNDLIEYRVRARTGALNWGNYRYSDGVLIDDGIPNPVGASEGYDIGGADEDWAMDNAYYVHWAAVPDTGSGISYQVQRSVNSGDWVTFTLSGSDCGAPHPGFCWGGDPIGHSDGDTIQYRVRAVTGAGVARSWPTSGDGITIDSTDPDSDVETGSLGVPYTPPAGSNPWPDQIDGEASDSGGSGVVLVQVLIYDSDTTPYEYWSGTDWTGTASSWLAASGTTNWSYPLAETSLTDGHNYVVQSRATDLAGNEQSSPYVGGFMYAASAPDAPVVTSTTHLDPDTWYNDNQPSFEWSEPDSAIGVVGYSIQLDQYSGTIPDKIQDTTQRTYDAATTPDGEWYFHVRAVDTAGQWGPAGHVRVLIDTTAPQPPADVTEGSPDVNWDADGDIVVHWSGVPDTGSGITYELERCVNGGLVGACSTSWASVDTGIADTFYAHNPGGYSDGDTVRYRVRATNGVSLSGDWTESDGMTIDNQTPAQPGGVFEDNTSEPDRDYHSVANGAVTVYWDTVENTGSEIAYRLEKELNNSGVWIFVAEGLTGNSHADSGSYSDDDEIIYRVTAVNGVGAEGAARESDGFTIDLDIPALPGWVREGVNTDPDWDYDDDGAFTVYWDTVADTGSGITYRLEKSVNDGAWQLVDGDISATNYADSASYTDGDTVRYRVTPINGAGTEGPYRLSDGITIDLDAPQAPAWIRENDPDVDFDTDGAVWVNWAAVADTGSGITYELQKQVNGGGWTTVEPALGVTSYNDTATYGDETFIEYQVIAHNGVGRSSAATTSDGVRVDTGTPGTPTGVGEGDAIGSDDDFDEDNTFYVFWNSVPATATGDQIYYTVDRNVNGSGWDTAVSGLTATSWEDPQAYSNGDQVAYRVIAFNGAGTPGTESVASDGITIDTGRPNSEIDTAGYYNAVSWPDQIDGTASDDYSEVALVEITIRDTDDNEWWNGSAWQGTETWLTASGADNWTYFLDDSNLTDGHNYDLQSRATDNAGNVETTLGSSSFIFADSGPEAPVISSSTHPVQTAWYNNDDPAFTWTIPGGPAPIVGYSYVLDQNTGTTPDTIYDTTGLSASYLDVSDGVWFFHVRALDDAGRWGPASHYRINIDTTAPNAPASVTDESPDVDYDFDGSVTVYWTAVPDTGSGISYIVERQIGAAAWTVLSDTVQTTSYLDPDTGYADGTFIHYRISARN
ncbi:MAG: hypothetical protein B6I35_07400, partial [Anaerolineaceae bacterium 4572_32.2]